MDREKLTHKIGDKNMSAIISKVFSLGFILLGLSLVTAVGSSQVNAEDKAAEDMLLGIPPPPSPVDFDQNGKVNVADVYAFLNAWLVNDPAADFDGNFIINANDVYAFIGEWFTEVGPISSTTAALVKCAVVNALKYH